MATNDYQWLLCASACHGLTRSAETRRVVPAKGMGKGARTNVVDVQPFIRRLRVSGGKTPQIMYLVREAEKLYPDDLDALSEVYRVALEMYGVAKSAQDCAFRYLCHRRMNALCSHSPKEARQFHDSLRANARDGWGLADALIYAARVTMEERLGNSAKAEELLREGIEVGARPPEVLERMLSIIKSEGFTTHRNVQSKRVVTNYHAAAPLASIEDTRPSPWEADFSSDSDTMICANLLDLELEGEFLECQERCPASHSSLIPKCMPSIVGVASCSLLPEKLGLPVMPPEMRLDADFDPFPESLPEPPCFAPPPRVAR